MSSRELKVVNIGNYRELVNILWRIRLMITRQVLNEYVKRELLNTLQRIP